MISASDATNHQWMIYYKHKTAPGFDDFGLIKSRVTHQEAKTESCVSCAQSSINPFILLNEKHESYFDGATDEDNDLAKLKNNCLTQNGPCESVSPMVRDIKVLHSFGRNDVLSVADDVGQSEHAAKWTKAYRCMHFVSVTPFKYAIDEREDISSDDDERDEKVRS